MDVEGLDTFSAYDAAPALDDGEPLGLGMSLDEAIARSHRPRSPHPDSRRSKVAMRARASSWAT